MNSTKNRSLPQISVVIPALNEEKLIGRSLQALREQNFSLNYEVIVVNGPSTDKTEKIANTYADKVINITIANVSHARKMGFKAARGEIIATTDADVFVPKNWLAQIYAVFHMHPKIIAITGPYKFINNEFLNIISGPVRLFTRAFHKLITGTELMSGNNSAFRKSYYLRSGGFNPNITGLEDVELAMRLKHLGQICYLPALLVSTMDRRFRNRIFRHVFRTLLPTYFKRVVLRTTDKDSVWPIIR